MDWDDGNDRMYTMLIPVTSREQAAELAELSVFRIQRCLPRLLETTWMGRE